MLIFLFVFLLTLEINTWLFVYFFISASLSAHLRNAVCQLAAAEPNKKAEIYTLASKRRCTTIHFFFNFSEVECLA